MEDTGRSGGLSYCSYNRRTTLRWKERGRWVKDQRHPSESSKTPVPHCHRPYRTPHLGPDPRRLCLLFSFTSRTLVTGGEDTRGVRTEFHRESSFPFIFSVGRLLYGFKVKVVIPSGV